ncbi:hypothetical protein D7S56_20955 [Ralstonia pickettii]|nr:hypothetical protein [Ralstonia pickettii]
MRLGDISPSRSISFSPNLYAWMKKEGHFYSDGGHAEQIYMVLPKSQLAECFGAETLMIGHPYNQYEGDSDFSGIRLFSALCLGARAGRMCYSGAMGSLKLVAGFWERYLEVGRCAIDPEHQEHFVGGERYAIRGETRSCLWCSTQHRRAVVPRAECDETWVAI